MRRIVEGLAVEERLGLRPPAAVLQSPQVRGPPRIGQAHTLASSPRDLTIHGQSARLVVDLQQPHRARLPLQLDTVTDFARNAPAVVEEAGLLHRELPPRSGGTGHPREKLPAINAGAARSQAVVGPVGGRGVIRQRGAHQPRVALIHPVRPNILWSGFAISGNGPAAPILVQQVIHQNVAGHGAVAPVAEGDSSPPDRIDGAVVPVVVNGVAVDVVARGDTHRHAGHGDAARPVAVDQVVPGDVVRRTQHQPVGPVVVGWRTGEGKAVALEEVLPGHGADGHGVAIAAEPSRPLAGHPVLIVEVVAPHHVVGTAHVQDVMATGCEDVVLDHVPVAGVRGADIEPDIQQDSLVVPVVYPAEALEYAIVDAVVLGVLLDPRPAPDLLVHVLLEAALADVVVVPPQDHQELLASVRLDPPHRHVGLPVQVDGAVRLAYLYLCPVVIGIGDAAALCRRPRPRRSDGRAVRSGQQVHRVPRLHVGIGHRQGARRARVHGLLPRSRSGG